MRERTILVIDNDEALVELQTFIFEERGYTVHRATDGRQGVDLALRHQPAVVVCDLIMDRMDGFEVLAALRGEPALQDTAVIVTSATAYKADIDRARKLGATEYLVKPFAIEDLLALVDRHMAGSTST